MILIYIFLLPTGEEEKEEALCPILEDKVCEAIDPASNFIEDFRDRLKTFSNFIIFVY